MQAAATLPGVAVARSRVLWHGGRTLLEMERFDRHGERGRGPLVSLAALDAEVLGQGHSDWPRLAQSLAALGWLARDEARRIAHLHWFGRLIANSDMHNGNLSFIPTGGRLTLAPVYDMLPMRYAPLAGGEVPPPALHELPQTRPDAADDWRAAAQAALQFWCLVSEAADISAPIRALGLQQARRLEGA